LVGFGWSIQQAPVGLRPPSACGTEKSRELPAFVVPVSIPFMEAAHVELATECLLGSD